MTEGGSLPLSSEPGSSPGVPNRKLPFYVRPDGVAHTTDAQDNELLESMVMEAAEKKFGGEIPAEYASRIEHELGVLCGGGMAVSILEAARAVEVQKQHGFPVAPGRGSVVASVCAWLLGCTHPDPIEHGLDFARFATPAKLAAGVLADIDTDMVPEARSVVAADLTERYGKDRVFPISNPSVIKPKSALTVAGKEWKEELKKKAKRIGRTLVSIKPDLDAITKMTRILSSRTSEEDNEEGILPAGTSRGQEELLRRAKEYIGKPGPISTSGASLVVLPRPASEMDVTIAEDTHGVRVLRMTAKEADKGGWLKVDYLSNKFLGVAHATETELRARDGGEGLDVRSELDLDNPAIYESVNGELSGIGIMQLNGSASRDFAGKMKPTNFSDLMVSISLSRPGVASAGDEYLRRRKGGKWEHIHPALKETLSETLGVFVYQEDFMRALKILAGFSDDDAARAMKSMSKKIPEEMEVYARPFCEQVCARHGNTPAEAAALWETMADAAKYAFNRAHACGYATMTAWGAWLRSMDPALYLRKFLEIKKDFDNKRDAEVARRFIGGGS